MKTKTIANKPSPKQAGHKAAKPRKQKTSETKGRRQPRQTAGKTPARVSAEESDQMQTLMNNLPVSIYFKDRASRFIRISKSLALSFGLNDPAQAIGKTDFDFFTEEHARQAYEDEQSIIQTGQPLIKEEKETRPNRPDAWVSTTKLPLRDRDEKIIGTIGISVDITGRKQAEDRLMFERNLLSTLIDNLPDDIYVKDLQGRKTISNVADWHNSGGKTLEDVLGKSDFDTYPPELAARYWADDKSVLDSGTPIINREEPGLDGQGNSRWVLATKVPLRDADGQITGLVGIGRDITDDKLAEEKLEERLAVERNLLSALLDNLPDRIYVKDMQGRKFISNIADWQASNAKTLEDVLGKSDFDTYPPELAAKYWADDKAVLDSGIPIINREEPGLDSQGNPIWVLTTKVPSRDRNGKITGLVGIGRDITDRKRAEEASHFHLAELEVLYENSLNISRLLEPRDIAQQLIESMAQKLAWHHAVVRLYTPETDRLEILAASQKGQTISQDEIKRLNQLVNRPGIGLAGWVVTHGEVILADDVHANEHYVETYAEIQSGIYVPIRIGEQTIGSISVESERKAAFTQRDKRLLSTLAAQSAAAFENAHLYQAVQKELAERRRAEEELRLSQETLEVYNARLEQNNRDLQEFAYVASHDLQEPLRKVMAFGDRLAGKYGDALDETGRDYLKRIQTSTQRMQTLLGDLLSYSRVSTRAQAFTEVDLHQVARDAVSDLETRLEKTKGKVEIGHLPIINADASQIYQLLQNLIANALKFHAADRPPIVRISAQVEDGQCHLLVKDNGIGFDIQYIDRIFKPFERLHSREAYEGTGMGLAICRRIAERHGGRITASSIPNEGSCFDIILPLQQSEGETI